MSNAYDVEGNIITTDNIEKITTSSKYGKFGRGFDDSVKTLQPIKTWVRDSRKIGRNEPCPCGSGLKYKKCHGG